MKRLIQSFAIWLLRKTKCSVIIGCRLEGKITLKNDIQYFYDNEGNCRFFYKEHEFTIPEGKFSRELNLG